VGGREFTIAPKLAEFDRVVLGSASEAALPVGQAVVAN
jgi:hypothetical protein